MSGTHLKAHLSFIIQDLDLTRITEFDHSANRDIKLTACSEVQPDIVPLWDNPSKIKSLNNQYKWLQKQTKTLLQILYNIYIYIFGSL